MTVEVLAPLDLDVAGPVERVARLEAFLVAAGFSNVTGAAWGCGGCGCLVLPMDSGDLYLDRYVAVRSDCGMEQMDCACHRLPEEMPAQLGTVTWVPEDGDGTRPAWMVACPDRVRCTACQVPRPVVYLHLLGLAGGVDDTHDGLYWLCGGCLAADVPARPRTPSGGEPVEQAEARKALEVMLTLGWVPAGLAAATG